MVIVHSEWPLHDWSSIEHHDDLILYLFYVYYGLLNLWWIILAQPFMHLLLPQLPHQSKNATYQDLCPRMLRWTISSNRSSFAVLPDPLFIYKGWTSRLPSVELLREFPSRFIINTKSHRGLSTKHCWINSPKQGQEPTYYSTSYLRLPKVVPQMRLSESDQQQMWECTVLCTALWLSSRLQDSALWTPSCPIQQIVELSKVEYLYIQYSTVWYSTVYCIILSTRHKTVRSLHCGTALYWVCIIYHVLDLYKTVP